MQSIQKSSKLSVIRAHPDVVWHRFTSE